MARYRNKAPLHLAPPDPTVLGCRMPKEREISIINCRVSCVGGGEDGKGGELGKGEEQVKDNPVSEGYRKHPMLLRGILEESSAEADKEGEEKE